VSAYTEEQVAEGRLLLGQLDGVQWALGDMAVGIFGQPSRRGAHDPAREDLDAFADAIGIAPKRLAEYRSVAWAWPPDIRRADASWVLHRSMVGNSERVTLMAAFLGACAEMDVMPSRERLREFCKEPPAKQDRSDLRPVQVPRNTEAAVEQLRRNAAELARQAREHDDRIVDVVLRMQPAVDPNNDAAVVAALVEAGMGTDEVSELLTGAARTLGSGLSYGRGRMTAQEAWHAIYASWWDRYATPHQDPWGEP